jgi:hypothetical protein
MATPPEPQSQWAVFISNLLPWATIYGLCHTAIFFVFKFFSKSRDDRTRQLIDERIEPLEAKIDKLLVKVDKIENK